jgi:2-polyprenyl-6-hydroxyphenyl methylase / 3-demethylubiquinone-9 3-methyltransferase
MAPRDDYFENHFLKLRFPWALYHRPIVGRLQQVLSSASNATVLNVGSGPFLEFDTLRAHGNRFAICDIDERAIEVARRHHGARLLGAEVSRVGEPLPFESNTFDLVVSMDVIEHVLCPEPWLSELVRVTRPGGRVFLTTPNYASFSLRLIENTALELVARCQGFSRRGIHPTKMTPARLGALLGGAGLDESVIDTVAFGWVLCSISRRPLQSRSGEESSV